MDKEAQIEILRKEHTIAVTKYDFDRAELIERQIQRLRTEISRDYDRTQYCVQDLDLDEQREKIRGKTARADASLIQKRMEIQKSFHEKFRALEERHTQQLTDLSLQHAAALDREVSRPVPEADILLAESVQHGKSHNYQRARELYQEAMKLKESVNEERRNECNVLYKRIKQKLQEKQEREKTLLMEKQESAISNLNQMHSKKTTTLANKLKVKEIKHEQQRALERTGMRTGTRPATARRSASVSRSSMRGPQGM